MTEDELDQCINELKEQHAAGKLTEKDIPALMDIITDLHGIASFRLGVIVMQRLHRQEFKQQQEAGVA